MFHIHPMVPIVQGWVDRERCRSTDAPWRFPPGLEIFLQAAVRDIMPAFLPMVAELNVIGLESLASKLSGTVNASWNGPVCGPWRAHQVVLERFRRRPVSVSEV